MAKVYFVRHQAAGVVHEFPFSQPPTEEQKSAIARLCFQRFGANHPKNDAPYWTRVEERELLGPSTVPDVPERALSVASAAGVGEFVVDAKGEVAPAGE